MNNRDKLMEVMLEKNLDRMELAEILRVKREQIDHWLLPGESKNHQEVPDMAIELLEIKLGYKSE